MEIKQGLSHKWCLKVCGYCKFRTFPPRTPHPGVTPGAVVLVIYTS